jgi:hypothetical protein
LLWRPCARWLPPLAGAHSDHATSLEQRLRLWLQICIAQNEGPLHKRG